MTTVDINLSQKTVSQLNSISSGQGTNLSNLFGQIVETNAYISETFYQANSWSSTATTVSLKFGNVATLTYKGTIAPDYPGAYTGSAIANSRTLNAPSYFKETVTGTLYYNYYASSTYLSYSPTGIATINSYKLESFQSNPNSGLTSIGLTGNISLNASNGNIAGTVSNLSVSLSKVGSLLISGSFDVVSNTNDSGSSSVTGTLSQYSQTYLDKSYIKITGNLSLQSGTVIKETSLANESYFSGDDSIKIILPTVIYSDYIMNAGSGNDIIAATGGGGRLFINAGSGNDEITVTDISPVLNGGDDTDTVKSSTISLNLNNYSNIENITLLGTISINAFGNSADNTLIGNSAVNTLNGGAGTDTLIGGAGNDTYVVDSTTDTITELANGGTDTIQSSVTFTLAALANVENLTLTGTSNINATGNAVANTLIGNNANNTLDGGTGIDILIGGAGNDTYIVDTTTDTITELANGGTDTIQSSVTFTLEALANVENLTLTGTSNINSTGNAAANTLTGNTANNTLDGGAGNDILNGGLGADTLIGGTGVDTLIGGAGNDTYVVDSTTDTITEISAEGTDTVRSSVTFSLANLAHVENLTYSGTAAWSGTGNSLNNVITGGAGADTLTGGTGNDTLIGGNGNDIYKVYKTTILSDVIVIDEAGASGIDTVEIYEDLDAVGAPIESRVTKSFSPTSSGGFKISFYLDQVLTGSFTVNGQIEFIRDYGISNGATFDTLIQVWTSSTPLTLSAKATGTVGYGSVNGDKLNGSVKGDKIYGFSGNDTIDGKGGADKLIGGEGSDTYLWSDLYKGDAVIDDESGAADQITVTTTGYINFSLDESGNTKINNYSPSSSNSAAIGSLTFTAGSIEKIKLALPAVLKDYSLTYNASLFGVYSDPTLLDVSSSSESYVLLAKSDYEFKLGSGVDFIIGDAIDNVKVNAGGGNDYISISAPGSNSDDVTIDGGTGADVMVGKAEGGAEFIFCVDNIKDIVIAQAPKTSGSYKIESSISYSLNDTLAGFSQGISSSSTKLVTALTLKGSSNINATGNAAANTLTGNTANNTLDGGAGNDTLTGGDGNDTLTGGDGNDIFLFNKAAGSTNLDTITDFTSGADVIQLSNKIFTKIGNPGTLSADAFWSAAGATSGNDSTDRIIYNTTTGALYYDADGNGSGLAVQIAIVGSQPTIAYTDIAIVS